MKPTRHIMCSGLLSGVIYRYTRNANLAIPLFLTGVFTDIDHIYEYGEYLKGKKTGEYSDMTDGVGNKHDFSYHLRNFLSGSFFTEKNSLHVYLHSWEAAFMMVSLSVSSLVRGRRADRTVKGTARSGMLRDILYGVTFGYVLHLVMDQIGNHMVSMTYFICYRKMKDWRFDILEQKKEEG